MQIFNGHDAIVISPIVYIEEDFSLKIPNRIATIEIWNT